MADDSLLALWALEEYATARSLASNNIDLTDPLTAERFFRDATRIMGETLGFSWLARELDSKQSGGYLLLGPQECQGPVGTAQWRS